MKRIMFALLAAVLTGPLVMAQGQSQPQSPVANIIPLPPNAAELFKYTGIPVSPMTGVPGISYSLYEINTGKIKVPISLNYHASGIKVNQRATWVGLGWSLGAGGNISRAVRGAPDETSLTGWFNHHTSIDTIDYIHNADILQAWMLNSPDAQPDFFSYNMPGKSGKFIYSRDSAMFMNFPYQPIIIKRIDFNKDGTPDTFEITDDDGTKYWFGQSQMFIDDTENHLEKYIQSWYVSHIISNDSKDTVYFRYNDPVLSGTEMTDDPTNSFSVMYHWTSEQFGGEWQKDEMVASSRSIQSSQVTLSEILFRQGKVVFYSKGAARNDGGNSLDSVVVYSKDGNSYSRVKKVSMKYGYFQSGTNTSMYDYRLKLLSFSKDDLSGGQPETYKFEYNNTPLPAITSYAVDYWGFYNGINNTSLMPVQKPAGFGLRLLGTHGTANREPSPTYMMAGILNKVIYPTGGFTSFDYEPNVYLVSKVEDKTLTLVSMDFYGKGKTTKTQNTANFSVVSPNNYPTHPVALKITFSPFSPNAFDVAQEVILKDVTTGQNIMVWNSDPYNNGTDHQYPHTVDYTYACDVTHTYSIIASIQDVTTTRLTVAVTANVPDSTKLTKSGAGIRVKTISTFNVDSSLQKRELYKYGINEDGIGYMPMIGDEVINNNYTNMSTLRAVIDENGCFIYTGGRITYFASYAYPTVNFQGAPVVYLSVSKYDIDGNGRPNGKTLMQYVAPSDYTMIPTPGTMGGKEYIDNSMSDALLQSEHIYKYNPVDSSYKVQKQTLYRYGGPIPIVRTTAVRMYKNYIWLTSDRCGASLEDEFGHDLFQIKTGGRRLADQEETIFDDNGNTMVSKTIYEYNRYGLPIAVKMTDSKNDTVTNRSFYPGDHTNAIAESAVLNRMVRRNMISQPYWQGNYRKNVLQKYNHTVFGDQWAANDSLIMPKTDSVWIIGGAQASVAVNYQSYDKYGNILQLTERNGITNSFTWNADNTYPLSQTVNATNTSVLCDGFEDAGTWTGITRDNTQARTGKYAGLITNAGAFVNQRWTSVSLTTASKFRYSGWVYSSGPGATINLLMKKAGETGAYSYIDNIALSQSGKWIYVEKEYNVPADVKSMSIRLDNTGTGKVWFDDIRLRPSSSRMITYTHSPLIGVTSKTDDNNIMLKYEYDGLGRLKVIRDQDGNVLKQIDYQYQAPLNK